MLFLLDCAHSSCSYSEDILLFYVISLLGSLQNEMREPLFKKEEKRAVKCELKYKVCLVFRGFFLPLSLFVSTCMMFYICFLIPSSSNPWRSVQTLTDV